MGTYMGVSQSYGYHFWGVPEYYSSLGSILGSPYFEEYIYIYMYTYICMYMVCIHMNECL